MDCRPSDETLLLGVAERDMGAFCTLYERHAGWLAIRLTRRCNDRDLVADAIQDTFIAVWQRPRGFRGDGDIAAWLWGIAIRRLVSHLRTRSSVAAVFEHAGAFRGVWLVGVAAVLAFAALAAAVGHARGLWFFLAVAPLAPCLVVAFSYDRRMDPALEPEMVTPYPALRLILLRTIAVLALALPAVLLLGLVVPGYAPFAWLLPAIGFVAVVLAASTWFSPLNAAMAVSAAWLMTVWLVATGSASPAAVLQARIQVAFLVLAAASFGIFLVRRRHLRQLRPWRKR
jgi:hypothetical protein